MLLRGVNVGTQKRLPMAELRAMAAKLGYANPRTHLQSGNLVLDAAVEGPAIERALGATVAAFLGREVAVLAIAAEGWAGYVAANPFPAETQSAPDRVLIVLGAAPPDAEALARAKAKAAFGERLAIAGGALWIFFPEGAGRSKLGTHPNATARNWRTVRAIEALLA